MVEKHENKNQTSLLKPLCICKIVVFLYSPVAFPYAMIIKYRSCGCIRTDILKLVVKC